MTEGTKKLVYENTMNSADFHAVTRWLDSRWAATIELAEALQADRAAAGVTDIGNRVTPRRPDCKPTSSPTTQ